MSPLVYEYAERKTLAKIGFTSDLSDLSVFEAEAFNLIASEFSRLEREEFKQKSRKK